MHQSVNHKSVDECNVLGDTSKPKFNKSFEQNKQEDKKGSCFKDIRTWKLKSFCKERKKRTVLLCILFYFYGNKNTIFSIKKCNLYLNYDVLWTIYLYTLIMKILYTL